MSSKLDYKFSEMIILTNSNGEEWLESALNLILTVDGDAFHFAKYGLVPAFSSWSDKCRHAKPSSTSTSTTTLVSVSTPGGGGKGSFEVQLSKSNKVKEIVDKYSKPFTPDIAIDDIVDPFESKVEIKDSQIENVIKKEEDFLSILLRLGGLITIPDLTDNTANT